MERLTLEDAISRSRKLAERHRWNSENTKLETSGENANEVYKNTCIQYANQEEQYAEWFEELRAYKDLEKQGLIGRLPVKIGDIVWDNCFGYPESYEIKAFSYGYCDSYVEPDIEDQIIFYYENYNGLITGSFPMSEIGKTVFSTREKAEKKLKEMKND